MQAIKSLKAESIECSICLERLIDNNSLVLAESSQAKTSQPCKIEETKGLVVALPCNALHMFHPNCIRMWLLKSPACPLCKTNAFTGNLHVEEEEE